MIGLRGARVLIVDDTESEALPIIKALAKKGIPAAYFTGDLKSLPDKADRFSGIRLAILDMDLVGGGTPDKSKVATLVSRLEQLLSPANGPYVVLAWTKHVELIEPFEEYLFDNKNIPNPIIIITLTKDQCIDKDGNCDLKVMEEKLAEALGMFNPLKFLQAWEEQNFHATSEVTNILSALTSGEKDPKKWREIWKNQLLNLMHALAQETMGDNLNKETVLNGLYYSLNPLYGDRIESLVAQLSPLLASDGEEILKQTEGCDHNRKSLINTMLHLAFEEDNFQPGNIYLYESKDMPKLSIDTDSILKDIVQKEHSFGEKLKDISSKCTLILIEISPYCDHSHGNIRAARFLSGLIVPESEHNKIKRGDDTSFIWKLGPVYINKGKLSGIYYIYFSARHLFTYDIDEAIKLRSFARIRSQALLHLQSWFAGHASRPGIVLLR